VDQVGDEEGRREEDRQAAQACGAVGETDGPQRPTDLGPPDRHQDEEHGRDVREVPRRAGLGGVPADRPERERQAQDQPDLAAQAQACQDARGEVDVQRAEQDRDAGLIDARAEGGHERHEQDRRHRRVDDIAHPGIADRHELVEEALGRDGQAKVQEGVGQRHEVVEAGDPALVHIGIDEVCQCGQRDADPRDVAQVRGECTLQALRTTVLVRHRLRIIRCDPGLADHVRQEPPGAVIVLVYARLTRSVSPEPAEAAVDADPATPRFDPPGPG